MSLLPHLLNALIDDYRHPLLHDQHFGLGLLNDEILQLAQGPVLPVPLRSGYLRPWRSMAAGDSGVSSYATSKDEFKINLDVQQFKPNELKVSVADGYLVIDGKHDERSDQHGLVSRQFTRRYKIPEEVDETKLSSNLSSDGVLSVSAPKIIKKEIEGREIPIIQTNQPALKQSVASQQQEKNKQEEKMES
ncbi:protein lethal(2)essential for life [Halyomorpha halys]|uniref:protein lethal(2)essential for life n=1 Tax=Halyomorpha halys TaxID=286706 RepID=UPI0006D4D5D4|nr:alpha-crystallin A chain-like [Halyomorpha halys]